MSIELSKCRICESSNITDLFDLGEQPLANALVYPVLPGQLNVSEPKYPLVLVQCEDCKHIQLKHTVTPEEMFVDYHFHTASSPRMVRHFASIINKFLPKDGLVVEIGSNDGSVLEEVTNNVGTSDVRLLGIDPSRNLCDEAFTRKVATHCAFFSKETAQGVVGLYGKAKLVLCANVLGHVPDLNDFVAGLKLLLADDGLLIIEVPHVLELYDRLAFDTIYHEHVSYFSIKCLTELMNKHGLYVTCVEKQEVHGGTIRCHIRSHGGNGWSVIPDILREDIVNLDWHYFEVQVGLLKYKLRSALANMMLEGKQVVGYGAAAKAAVLLNYCNITTDLLQYVVDCTWDKQGKLMPGTHQKVIAPEKLWDILQQQAGPEVMLILAWNHAEEIVRKEQNKYPNTTFITPDLITVQARAQKD